jgi:hypothetical protein
VRPVSCSTLVVRRGGCLDPPVQRQTSR